MAEAFEFELQRNQRPRVVNLDRSLRHLYCVECLMDARETQDGLCRPCHDYLIVPRARRNAA